MIYALRIKPPASVRWDCVSLGEVMLRLDPVEDRIHTARSFRVWEGGGEITWLAGCVAALACAPPLQRHWRTMRSADSWKI